MAYMYFEVALTAFIWLVGIGIWIEDLRGWWM